MCVERTNLGTFTTDTSCQLDVLGHDSHTLGVNGTQVGVFEESDQVSLAGLLESHHSRGLESQVCLEILGNFSDETLEWQLADEQFGGFLVPPDFTESHGSRPISVGLLHTTGGRGALPGGLCGQLFSGSFTSGRFTRCLLGTSHFSELAYRCPQTLFYTAALTPQTLAAGWTIPNRFPV